MNAIDLRALAHLQTTGRESWTRLGQLLRLTGPAAAERVRKLEESGIIQGYAAVLSASALGIALTAFVAVTLERPQHRRAFLAKVSALPEVQECHHVAGDDDYLLKLRCLDAADLDRIVSGEIKSVPGVARTRTTVVLRTEKETSALPLRASPPRRERGARRGKSGSKKKP